MGTNRKSLRWRLGGWSVAVVSVTLLVATVLRGVDEQRRMVSRETAAAHSLLDRLAGTPEMSRNVDDARAWLHVVQPVLGAQRASVTLARQTEPVPDGWTVLATRRLQLPEGGFDLRYQLSQASFAAAVRRALAFHAIHGVLTLLLLLAGMEWILRRRLLAPLRQLSHQVHHMSAGGGWIPVLPDTDAEMTEIRSAVRDLGPALAGQVDQWIQGERRAAVTLALGRLRGRLREPQRRALVLLGDLQANGGVTPAGKAKARALIREVEGLSQVINEVEFENLAAALDRSLGKLPDPGPRHSA